MARLEDLMREAGFRAEHGLDVGEDVRLGWRKRPRLAPSLEDVSRGLGDRLSARLDALEPPSIR